MGPSCGSFWRVVGPPRALVGLCLGSCSVSFGALVAFGVRVLRDVVDFSCHGGQVEASRSVLEAFGGHSGAPKTSKPLKTQSSASKAKQRKAKQRKAKQGKAKQGNTKQSKAKPSKTKQNKAMHS